MMRSRYCPSRIEAADNMRYASYLLHFPLQLALVFVFASLGASLPLYVPDSLVCS